MFSVRAFSSVAGDVFFIAVTVHVYQHERKQNSELTMVNPVTNPVLSTWGEKVIAIF